MANVLLVTDYAGQLHITPIGNKAFYQNRNKIVKTKQYKFREMSEEDANAFVVKNKGADPEHLTAQKAAGMINDKDAEIAALKKQLEELQAGKAKKEYADTADVVIAKIIAAETIDQVDELVKDDERKTVVNAADKKRAELTK